MNSGDSMTASVIEISAIMASTETSMAGPLWPIIPDKDVSALPWAPTCWPPTRLFTSTLNTWARARLKSMIW